jgi:hypothetical protein
MVIVVPEMPATSHRGSVHAPFPPVKTNSMSPGLRHPASVGALAV